MRVFITSYPGPELERAVARLVGLHAASDRRHELTSSPDTADIILVVGIGNTPRENEYLDQLAELDVIRKHANKCFTISHRAEPLVLNRGIYESARSNLLTWGRVKTGGYACSGSFNSHVKSHVATSARDRGKKYLLSFVGRRSHPIRQRLFDIQFSRSDVLIKDSSDFRMWSEKDPTVREDRQREYYEILLATKFSLCPRGIGAGSIRLFESLKLGVVPIVISDGWIAPRCAEWSRCTITVKERHILDVERIASEHESKYEEMSRLAIDCYESRFSEASYFNYIVESCTSMARTQVVPESVLWSMRRPIVKVSKIGRSLRRNRTIKRLVRGFGGDAGLTSRSWT
ncbi:MAG: exostosin family protein [Deltaproteobacteria bacterium]|nr:exostosin family protein [Deltaproteobacteria bacterium]